MTYYLPSNGYMEWAHDSLEFAEKVPIKKSFKTIDSKCYKKEKKISLSGRNSSGQLIDQI